MLRVLSLASITVFLLGAGAGISIAGEEDEVLINSDIFGKAEARSPAIAALPDSSLIVAWVDARRGHRDVFAARVNSEGELLGEVELLNDDNKMVEQFDPVVAASPDGSQLWVAWTDERGKPNIFVQRLSADGSPIGDNIPVLEEGGNYSPQNLSVAVAPDGVALIAWQEFNSFNSTNSIRGRRIGADGLPLGDSYTEIFESGLRPGVAYHPSGGWAIVWDEIQGLSNYDARFALLDDMLNQVGQNFPLSETNAGDQLDAQINVRADSSSVVAWRDTRGGEANVFVRLFSFSGIPMSSEVQVQEDHPAQEKDLVLSTSEDGTFLVSWLGADETGDWIPFARSFLSDATPDGDTFRVDDPNDVVGLSLSMTAMPTGRYACVWVDQRAGPGLAYMKTVDPPQTFPEFAIPLLHLEPGATQVFPDVALQADGTGMVIWVDQRTGSPNLFGQMLDTDGEPSGEDFLISEQPIGRFGDPLDITTFLASTPKVATADSANYVVTWLSSPGTEGGVVLAQFYDGNGSPLGNNVVVAPEHAQIAQASPSAMVDNRTGRMAVVWEDNLSDTGGDVFLRRYTSLGEADGSIIPLVDEDRRTAAQVLCSSDISSFGEILAAWVDNRNGGNDIYAQIYHIEEDVPIDNMFIAGEDQGGINFDQLNPSVAIGPSSYVIVWDDNGSGRFTVRGLLTIRDTFDKENRLDPSERTVRLDISEPPEGRDQHFPKVSMDINSRIVVTWWDNYEGQAKILGRLYEPEGNPFTDPFLVTPFREEASRFSPSVDTRGDSIQFVFADSRRWLGWDIYSRRADWGFEGDSIPDDTTIVPVFVSQAGILPLEEGLRVQWIAPTDIFPSSFFIARRGPLLNPVDPLTGTLEEFSEVSWIDRAGRLMGWTDHEVTRGESYAYWILLHEHGPVSGPLLATYDPTILADLSAYPVPFGDEVTFRLPPADVRRLLEIYDVRGRRVWQGAWPGGSDPILVTWDGRNRQGDQMPQGIYWARLRGPADSQTVRILRLRR